VELRRGTHKRKKERKKKSHGHLVEKRIERRIRHYFAGCIVME